MTFYLIGLGLGVNSISVDALDKVRNCDMVYLEGYTVNFPYGIEDLKAFLEVEFEVLSREEVEGESVLEEAKERSVALLVYGDPFSATTHFQLKRACKEKGIEFKIYHNSSIMGAVGSSGLSLYKFGKVSSIPSWAEHTNKPTSFMKYVLENKSIGAHSLILCDIGLKFVDALNQLKISSEKENVELDKFLVISQAGTKNQKMVYGGLGELATEKIDEPYCFVVPGELSRLERDFLEDI